MSVSVDPCASPPSGTLSCYVTTATAVAAAITFSASGAAPTPLYHEYQEHLITAIATRALAVCSFCATPNLLQACSNALPIASSVSGSNQV